MKLTKSKMGFDAQIEVGGSTFHLNTVNEETGQFTHIDIHDENGKFIDEYASGFAIDLDDELERVGKLIHDYINENLTF